MSGSARIVVNGTEHELALEPDRSLLGALREELGLTGAKYGCGEGECGACTVLVDGEPQRACRVPIADADGRSVTTVEALAIEGRLHPAQLAFAEVGAMQCGYCTAGMVVAAAALLATDPDPEEERIREALERNICRCGTYPRIVRAVRRAAGLGREGGSPAEPPEVGPTAFEPRVRPRAPWDLTLHEDRDFFEVLSEGLVVVLPEEPARSDRWSTSAGAWIHVGADGVVTGFTGKVDVGQDNRSALSQLVAEELGAPIGSVRLVMGDTDLCPYDEGTFGSRSTPDAGENLRATAAAARALLLETAAGRWEVDPAALVATDGRVREIDGDRAVSFGELVRGGRRVETAAVEVRLPPRPSERASRPPITRTALETVTGARRFPADIVRPGTLHGMVLRPPTFGSSLRSVALEEARAVPGVIVVHEGSFVGVAAPDLPTARRAIRAIRSEWEITPQPSERDLVEHLRSHPVEEHGWGGAFRHASGDVEAGLAAASVRLEGTYTTAYIAHVPLETRVALAEWEGEHLTVWTGTQRPFGVRAELAEELEIAEEQVRVIVPDPGGGYGGKHSGDVAIEAARLARASGRPVRVRWNREEEFTWAYFRPAAVIDVRSGASAEGALTAWEFLNVNAGSAAIGCPYDIPNQRIEYQPAASPLPQGSYRALAATANHFARESHLDELAHLLEIDPLELRLRHLSDDRLAEVFRAVADRAGWAGRSREPGYGMGIAGGVEKDARVATCVEVRVDRDGRLDVLRVVTAFECGAIVDADNLVNQIEGATVMGLGGALFEAIRFEEGRILNPRLSEYRVPRFGDVPQIDISLLDRPDVPSAGAGETPIVAVAPALANAVFAATGRRIRSLPIAPGGMVG
jgi:isoquinoline 1-oxidoreductase